MNRRLITIIVFGVLLTVGLALGIAGLCGAFTQKTEPTQIPSVTATTVAPRTEVTVGTPTVSPQGQLCGTFERKGRSFQFWATVPLDADTAKVYEVKTVEGKKFYRLGDLVDTEGLVDQPLNLVETPCDASLLAKLEALPEVLVTCADTTLSTKNQLFDHEGGYILNEFSTMYGIKDNKCVRMSQVFAVWTRNNAPAVYVHLSKPGEDKKVNATAISFGPDVVTAVAVNENSVGVIDLVNQLSTTVDRRDVELMTFEQWERDLLEDIEKTHKTAGSLCDPKVTEVKFIVGASLLDAFLSEEGKITVKSLEMISCPQFCAQVKIEKRTFLVWNQVNKVRAIEKVHNNYYMPVAPVVLDRGVVTIESDQPLSLTDAGFKSNIVKKSTARNIRSCPAVFEQIQRVHDASEKLKGQNFMCGAVNLATAPVAINFMDPALVAIGKQGYTIKDGSCKASGMITH